MREINRHQAVFVLGMHRSGTSALMRVLNLLGVELGGAPLSPKEDNPTGFWEHGKLVRVHDEVLKSWGCSWDSVQALPEDWHLQPGIDAYRRKIAKIYRRDFADKALWGLKDPRVCRLIPLWKPILQAADCRTNYILIVRNPREVAASLHKRNHLTPDQSYALWLDYMTHAIRGTEGEPRVVVSYSRLIKNWRATVSKISDALGLEWPRNVSSESYKVDAFLQKTLRHHQADDLSFISDKNIALCIREAYAALMQAERGDFRLLEILSKDMRHRRNNAGAVAAKVLA